MPSNPTPALPELFVVDGKPVTSSLKVADFFKKDHGNVLRDVRALIEQLPSEFTGLNFEASEYLDSTGRSLPAYRLTRDGFTLLAMGFTGKKALAFKLAYIEAFNRMEAQLRESTPWAAALRDQIRLGETVAELARALEKARDEVAVASLRCALRDLSQLTVEDIRVLGYQEPYERRPTKAARGIPMRGYAGQRARP